MRLRAEIGLGMSEGMRKELHSSDQADSPAATHAAYYETGYPGQRLGTGRRSRVNGDIIWGRFAEKAPADGDRASKAERWR